MGRIVWWGGKKKFSVFKIRLPEIVLIRHAEGKPSRIRLHVAQHRRNVTFFITWWSMKSLTPT